MTAHKAATAMIALITGPPPITELQPLLPYLTAMAAGMTGLAVSAQAIGASSIGHAAAIAAFEAGSLTYVSKKVFGA